MAETLNKDNVIISATGGSVAHADNTAKDVDPTKTYDGTDAEKKKSSSGDNGGSSSGESGNTLKSSAASKAVSNITQNSDDVGETDQYGEAIFEYPLNPTDPKVYHDPSFQAVARNQLALTGSPTATNSAKVKQAMFVKPLEGNVNDDGTYPENQPTKEWTPRIEGIYAPIVSVGTKTLNWDNIASLSILFDYYHFRPTLVLEVKDYTESFDFSGSFGMNSEVNVAFVPTIPNTYRTIKLSFYNSHPQQLSKTNAVYVGYLKWLPIDQTLTCCNIQYKGCKHKLQTKENGKTIKLKCNSSSQVYPNTWEMLHEIALTTGLGFESTDECKNVKDYSLMTFGGMSYEKFMKYRLARCGKGSKNIFDFWINLYGYITMVNLPYIFNSKVTGKNFSMQAAVGMIGSTEGVPNQYAEKTNRVLTNFNLMGKNSNTIFTDLEWVENHEDQYEHGTNVTVGNIYMADAEAEDQYGGVEIVDIEAAEDSYSGHQLKDYGIQGRINKQINSNKHYNETLQQEINRTYLTKKRAIRLKVTLQQVNFAIQRGTLIELAVYENRAPMKQKLITNMRNAAYQLAKKTNESKVTVGETLINAMPRSGKTANNELIINRTFEFTKQDKDLESLMSADNLEMSHFDVDGADKEIDEKELVNSEAQIPNWFISGLYYVDGMNFLYYDWQGDIKQELYLIKKDWTLRMNDKYIPVRFDPNVFTNG